MWLWSLGTYTVRPPIRDGVRGNQGPRRAQGSERRVPETHRQMTQGRTSAGQLDEKQVRETAERRKGGLGSGDQSPTWRGGGVRQVAKNYGPEEQGGHLGWGAGLGSPVFTQTHTLASRSPGTQPSPEPGPPIPPESDAAPTTRLPPDDPTFQSPQAWMPHGAAKMRPPFVLGGPCCGHRPCSRSRAAL